jgi:signal transduction histidine kinase
MDLLDRLAEHKTLGAAPREQLAWLAARGRLRNLKTGEILTAKASGRVEGLFVILSGHIAVHIDRGAGRHKIAEWRTGDVTGLLPYSRLVSPPGDTVAEEPTEIVVVDRDHLPAMILECHELTSILVHVMLDRARHFTSSALHDEKLVSLGKLAAGLAHELNNPASAVERSARLLSEGLEASERASRALGGARLTDAELTAVDAVRESCLAAPPRGVRSPIEEAAREDALAGWLASRGADTSLAEALADTAVTREALDRLAAAVGGAALDATLRWVAAGCSVRGLASEIQEAAARISGLVTAVKGFTRMDQAPAAEPVDLEQGLASTVAVLKAKARAKSVAVQIEVEPDLPPVLGQAGHLNQVWANLIDNALDAVPVSGHVDVIAKRAGRTVVVLVADDGPGIPAEIKDRIFDPFFTTKPVGEGTGLGLDIVRRLVRQQDGEIDVESRPGRTEFRVSLPVAEAGPREERT